MYKLPKIIRDGHYLRVQFEDGNMLPETNLIIESPVDLIGGKVHVTVSFDADITDLKDDKLFIRTMKENESLQRDIKSLKERIKGNKPFWKRMLND